MTMPDRDPPACAGEPMRIRGDYSLQALAALDGVLIHAALNGETVGYFFGPTEEAAADAVGRPS